MVEAPETITAAEIQAEPNAEVRRVMLERFGAARYIQEIGAKEIDRDLDQYGARRVLYQAEMDGDEPLVMVQVVNSTPEPDGTYHEYWLRVDPRCRTAREAVASTARWPDGRRVFSFNETPRVET